MKTAQLLALAALAVCLSACDQVRLPGAGDTAAQQADGSQDDVTISEVATDAADEELPVFALAVPAGQGVQAEEP